MKSKDRMLPSGVGEKASSLVRLLEIIGGKWKIQIVSHLLGGTKRFSELRRLLPKISRGMLSYELKRLQRDGIVQRTQYETIPPTVEYHLTSKGAALKPVLVALHEWSEGHEFTRTELSSERK
jgi:DNA-binding HxlR family transcriptional regulator